MSSGRLNLPPPAAPLCGLDVVRNGGQTLATTPAGYPVARGGGFEPPVGGGQLSLLWDLGSVSGRLS